MKQKKHLYKNGLPFDSKLAENIDCLKERIRIGKASLLILDGGLGEGKTTLGIHIGDYYQGKEMILKEQYSMGGLNFQEKLEICYIKKYPVIIYDEAGDFSRRGALTYFNKQLTRIFETYRAFKILIIMILPCVAVLDSGMFFNKIPQLLLNVINRSESYGNYRGYGLYRMSYILHHMGKSVVKQKAYDYVRPNFRGHFLDLPPARSKELEKICTAGKLKIISKATIEAQGFHSLKTLSYKLNRSTVWVRSKIKAEGIKPVKTYKKANYYDKEVLQILNDMVGGMGK